MLAHSAVEIIDESCGVARSKADAKCHSSVSSTQLEMNCGCWTGLTRQELRFKCLANDGNIHAWLKLWDQEELKKIKRLFCFKSDTVFCLFMAVALRAKDGKRSELRYGHGWARWCAKNCYIGSFSHLFCFPKKERYVTSQGLSRMVARFSCLFLVARKQNTCRREMGFPIRTPSAEQTVPQFIDRAF